MTLENYLILLLGVILALVLIAIKNFIFIEKLKYDIYVLKHIALHLLNELEKLTYELNKKLTKEINSMVHENFGYSR